MEKPTIENLTKVIEVMANLQTKKDHIKTLDERMNDLIEKYRMNQMQIKDIENKLELAKRSEFFQNLEKYTLLLQCLKGREKEIGDEGKSYKIKKETLLKEIEISTNNSQIYFEFFKDTRLKQVENEKISICKVGSLFLRIAEFLFSNKTCNEVFYPMVGDWREDYLVALKAGKIFDAIFISIRNYLNFIYTMLIYGKLGRLIEFAMKISDVIEFFNKFSK